MSEQHDAQWEEQVRLGALEAFTFFRRQLRSGEPLDEATREGLIAMLDYTEAHLVTIWELLRDLDTRKPLHLKVTQQACDRIRKGLK